MGILRILILLILLLSHCLLSAEEEYLFGVEEIEYLPYYQTVNGEYVGFARDLFDEFARTQGIRFKYLPLPVKRLYRDFYSQKLDFKFPDNPKWGTSIRKTLPMSYSYPFLPGSDGLFVLPEKESITAKNIQSITSVLGFYPNLGFEDKIKDGTIAFEKSRSVEGALVQVLEGRTDGAFMSIAVAKYHLKQMSKIDGLILAANLPTIDSAQSIGTTKHPELMKAFDQFLIENGAFVNQLAKKYDIEWHKPE